MSLWVSSAAHALEWGSLGCCRFPLSPHQGVL